MIINIGKHKRRNWTVEQLVLNDPDYVLYMSKRPQPHWKLRNILNEAERLIRIFDSKPFTERCSKPGCTRKAAGGVVYDCTTNIRFYCNRCVPSAAASGKLRELNTYMGVVGYGNQRCNGNDKEMGQMVRAIAYAKGLEPPITKRRANAFFK